MTMRLHIGGAGAEAVPGWKVLDIQPGPSVDFVGDCTDLGQFADGSIEEIYASHVLEHLGYLEELPRALAEFHRVLKQGGCAKISVPDFDALCRMFTEPGLTLDERILVMRMAFGGQTDPFDFHYVGLSADILGSLLKDAGFARAERVDEFRLFSDTSSHRFRGRLISLNLIAYK
ncbi:MAG TPA: methyltransferase domain-containing protein [Burkholderiales bacterium]|jgi:predicted SAM-dependent methyltransferase|nr:methyltransferase domain-containing protein [Burkholderiales bacterium]